MSGDSNYGGNGSIYWSVTHGNGGRLEMKDGNYGWDRGGNAANPNMARKAWTPALEQGEWLEVSAAHPGRLKARDSRASTTFEVELRFDASPDGAAAATAQRRAAIVGILQKLIGDAQGALADFNAGADDRTIRVEVPVINRPAPPVNNFEVTVRWR